MYLDGAKKFSINLSLEMATCPSIGREFEVLRRDAVIYACQNRSFGLSTRRNRGAIHVHGLAQIVAPPGTHHLSLGSSSEHLATHMISNHVSLCVELDIFALC